MPIHRRIPLLVQFALAASLALLVTYGLSTVVLAKTAEKGPAKKALDGAKLYDINCNRCHSERYPTEHTEAEWKTLVMHMRVRANLPPEQAKAILKYLQENSGK